MAVIAVALSQGTWRVPRRLSGRHSLAVLLGVCSLVTLAFWTLGSWANPWALRALYVWTGLLSTLAGLQFWLILGELYTVTQAKRLYRAIGSGSLLGAVAGAGLARVIAERSSPEHLVLASAAILVLTAAGPALLVCRPEGLGRSSGLGRGAPLAQAVHLLRSQPYVRGLAGLVLVSTVALTLADYVFKSAVARIIPAADLGAFFATVYMVLNVLALAAQLLAMGWLLRVLGLHRALWVLPVLVALGAGGVAFGGGLVAALLLKGADGTLRHSLHRTTTELLFLPIPDSLRARSKPLIDVVGQRGGQALASVFILTEVVLQRGDTVLATAAFGLCVVWIALAADLRQHYLNLFRAALREGSLHGSVDLAQIDIGSLETLFVALNSGDDAEVLGAIDLLATGGRARLVPALILFHPSRKVVLRALALFAQSGRSDFVPVADRLSSHPDPEIRAAALRARTAAQADAGPLRIAAQDADPLVRATALAALVSRGWGSGDPQRALDLLLREGSPQAHVAVATAIRQEPAPAFEGILLQLADSPRDEVRTHVARAMGVVRSERFLTPLLEMLGSREVREDARAALTAYGSSGLRFLDAALGDRALPHEIRRHLPRTLSRFDGAEAAPLLLGRLLDESDGMVRYKIIRALGRLSVEQPQVAMDVRIVEEAAARTLEVAFRLIHWRLVLERGAREDPGRATPGHHLLATLLKDKEVHAVERLFRLLALLSRGEDFKRIHRGLRNENRKIRASSQELLEHVVDQRLRGAVLALVDETDDDDRLARAHPFYQTTPLGYESLLATILDLPSETLSSIVAYHIAELGLVGFRERLEAFDPRQTGFFLTRVIEKALKLLTAPDPGRPVPDAG